MPGGTTVTPGGGGGSVEWTRVELDPDIEKSSIMLMMPPIATATFYSGDISFAAHKLRARVKLILQANPWLAGRLRKDKIKGVGLVVPSSYDPESYVVFVENDIGVRFKQCYANTVKHALNLKNGLTVKKGSACVDKDESLFKVGICPAGKGMWAMIVNLSHVLGDGHTFYKVYGMLGDNAKIEALDTTRVAGFKEMALAAVGQKKYEWVTGPKFLFGMLFSVLRWSSKTPVLRYFKPEWIKTQKDAFTATKDVPFVSTNDILTSEFLSNIKMDFGMMAINFRGRLPGITDNLAGNYENVVGYWSQECMHPNQIRKSLMSPPNFSGNDDPPGLAKSLKGRLPIVTNWSTFYQDVNVPGCIQAIHMPMFPPGGPGYSAVIIFKPTATTLGALVEVRDKKSWHRIDKHSMFGNNVLA